MTTSAASRPARHACSDKNLMSVLDPDVPEQLKLLNFVNFITNELAEVRAADRLGYPLGYPCRRALNFRSWICHLTQQFCYRMVPNH